MKKKSGNYLRFNEIRINDYGVFQGLNTFVFKRVCTVIFGENGTGKTGVFNALSKPGVAGEPALNDYSELKSDVSVNVLVSGCPLLVKKYKQIIFLGSDAAQTLVDERQQIMFDYDIDSDQQQQIRVEERKNFRRLLCNKPSKIKIHEDLNPDQMATGETVCLGYAFAFSVRRVLRLNIPAVFDSPYGLLDPALTAGAALFLSQQDCQQILIGLPAEFLTGDKADYRL